MENCWDDPEPECLSGISTHIDSGIADHIFSLRNSSANAFQCLYAGWLDVQDLFGDHLPQLDNEPICWPNWDEYSCWHVVYANMNTSHPCPNVTGMRPEINITRGCDGSGQWMKADYYSCLNDEFLEKVQCVDNPELYSHCETTEPMDPRRFILAKILRDIYFYGGIASLLLLSIALLIFCCFKSLQCPRVHIHKNLLVSLMLQCIVHIVMFEPYINMDTNLIQLNSSESADLTSTDVNCTGSDCLYYEEGNSRIIYQDILWLCNSLNTLSMMTYMTNIFWAFVEGLFLYSRISIAVFSTETPYWLFYLIGWGVPVICIIPWAVCMHFFHPIHQCWGNFSSYGFFWIIAAPIVAASVANTIFLICIIRILVTKLHTAHSAEHVQVRKAMKATLVLLPLLSITTLFYIWSPPLPKSPMAHLAYRIINASLQVLQGIFVSVLFCFFNGEVRAAMMPYWNKWRLGAFRYRNSRASSVCVTQSETALSKGPPTRIKRYDAVAVVSALAPNDILLAASNRRQSHSSYLSTDNHYSNNHSLSAPVSAV